MGPPARVLIVDDSPTILKVVSAILARHGYEPTMAKDGLAGIELVKKGPKFDLILLDFVMPRMNGYQF
jgi:CheY-like chemotaxis protein